jgi:NADH-quinone oxidoreductase subunit F
MSATPSVPVKKVVVGLGSCGIAAGARKTYEHLRGVLAEKNLPVELGITSCVGMCYLEPIVEVIHEDGQRFMYRKVTEKKAERIVDDHVVDGKPVESMLVDLESEDSGDAAYYRKQVRIVLRNCGIIDPESIDDYIAAGGYKAIELAMKNGPDWVIDEMKKSGLRGRGGGGFPTGMKWGFCRQAEGTPKYVVCNADEGDPGAFMDRSTIEGDPHSVLEGMLVCAYAIGASEGVVYCRAEYPLAVKRLNIAIGQASAKGLLDAPLGDSGFQFHIKVKEGAGAFVCGEETALLNSIMGQRGMPRFRPPFPAQAGLWYKPTDINNVETFANVPWILTNGGDAFAKYGTEKSKGSKVFALAGRIKRGGLVEVPMGLTIREIVNEIAGGTVGKGRTIKAVQMGGPSGGCIPESLHDTHIDYDEVTKTGAIMGSGGMVVMDDTSCMVDIARFFLQFTQDESCGKCTFCRTGTKRMLEILTRVTEGKAEMKDLDLLEELADRIKRTSLCGLGQTAPNPVLTTLKYFRKEYETHIVDRKCPAGRCPDLTTFFISDECNGCMACAKACPTNCISGEKKKLHVIDQDKCIRCSVCRDKCKYNAVTVI